MLKSACKKCCILLVLVYFIHGNVPQAFGQDTEIRKPRFKFQHVARELSNNQVFTIFQDRYGFFWIGTLGGLHRYRGEEYDLFVSSQAANSIPDSRVEKVYEDSKGNLWIGTHNGLSRYNAEMNNFVRYETEHEFVDPLDPNTNRIREIIEDSNGRLWVASQRTGLSFYDQNKDQFFPYVTTNGNPLATTNLSAICPDGNGTLWIGTMDDGVKRLDTKTGNVIHYRHNPHDAKSLGSNHVSGIAVDQQHTVWVATNSTGVDRLVGNDSSATFIHYRNDPSKAHSLANNDVRMIFVDSGNNVWSCNENGGLNLYSREHDLFFSYMPEPTDQFSIYSNSYWCIYEDQQKRLWLGSSLNGIDLIDRNLTTFNHFYKTGSNASSISNDIVRGFYEDSGGNWWIATDGGGLNVYERAENSFKVFRYDKNDSRSIRSDAVLTICEVDGELWVGTWQGGINILDRARKHFRQLEPGNTKLRNIFKIVNGRDGDVWISTYNGGITRYNTKTKTFETFLNNPRDTTSIGSNIVPVIIQDSKGNIWVGTQDNGVNLLKAENIENGKFDRFSFPSGDSLTLSSKLINDIYEDSRGTIWVATSSGLSKFLNEKTGFKTYSIQHGLASEHIKSIIEDNHGNLWLGTTKGLSKFGRQKESFINYDNSDGLQGGEFSRYGAYKTSDGQLLFGGTHGFNAFIPDSIKRNNYIPKVFLTGLRVFNKPVVVGEGSALPKQIMQLDEITLPYNYSVFTLEFMAINHLLPEKISYAYKLEGFEENWNIVNNQHSATYTNLDPRTYYFHVKASNKDGVWSNEAKVLKIIITPPFWKTWWFRSAIIALFAVSFYMVVTFRLRQLRRKNTQLENRVSDRTAQLRGLIQELQLKQNEIATTNEKLQATLEDLVQQKSKVESINNELKSAHEELLTINNQLDERVHERTVKLLKANQELDRFVYSASHDLSAPLKSILGLIQLTRLENKNEALSNHLEHMQKSVLKLEGVINSLTQFSRNMGHALMQQEIVFDEMIEEVLDELKYPFHADKVKIIKNYGAQDVLTSDYLRLKIILSNLISNALKYRNVNVQSHVEITFRKNGDKHRIQIQDNGIGISSENQARIFEMFYRGTQQSNGSGLGLYIVKETVEKLGGSITVESEPGSFTRFIAIL